MAPRVASSTQTPLQTSLVGSLLSSGRLVRIPRSKLSVLLPRLPLLALHAATGHAENASVAPAALPTPLLLPSLMAGCLCCPGRLMPRHLMPRSPLPLLAPLCTRSAAPTWALLRLHPPLLSLASLRRLAGSLQPSDALFDSGSSVHARDRARGLARGSAPPPKRHSAAALEDSDLENVRHDTQSGIPPSRAPALWIRQPACSTANDDLEDGELRSMSDHEDPPCPAPAAHAAPSPASVVSCVLDVTETRLRPAVFDPTCGFQGEGPLLRWSFQLASKPLATRARRPPLLAFDATCGYPGEGPPKLCASHPTSPDPSPLYAPPAVNRDSAAAPPGSAAAWGSGRRFTLRFKVDGVVEFARPLELQDRCQPAPSSLAPSSAGALDAAQPPSPSPSTQETIQPP